MKQITLLQATDKRFIGKHFGANRTPLQLPTLPLDWFHVAKQWEVPSDLWEILSHAESQGSFAVIRGTMKPNTTQPSPRRFCYIDDQPRSWIALDIDGVEGKDEGPKHACSQLPDTFRGVECWWQRSSSAGIKPGRRYRFFFALDAPLSCADLKARFKAKNTWGIDPALFSKAQLTFLSRPKFDVPSDDPFKPDQRSGVLAGSPHVSSSQILAMQTHSPKNSLHSPVAIENGRFNGRFERYAQSTYQAKLQDIQAASAPGGRHIRLRDHMIRVARLFNGANLPERLKATALQTMALASYEHRPEDEYEIERLFNWVLTNVDEESYPEDPKHV